MKISVPLSLSISGNFFLEKGKIFANLQKFLCNNDTIPHNDEYSPLFRLNWIS